MSERLGPARHVWCPYEKRRRGHRPRAHTHMHTHRGKATRTHGSGRPSARRGGRPWREPALPAMPPKRTRCFHWAAKPARETAVRETAVRVDGARAWSRGEGRLSASETLSARRKCPNCRPSSAQSVTTGPRRCCGLLGYGSRAPAPRPGWRAGAAPDGNGKALWHQDRPRGRSTGFGVRRQASSTHSAQLLCVLG